MVPGTGRMRGVVGAGTKSWCRCEGTGSVPLMLGARSWVVMGKPRVEEAACQVCSCLIEMLQALASCGNVSTEGVEQIFSVL